MVLLCHNMANVGLLPSDPVTMGEQIVFSLRLRFAAGVFCVLTAGLLIGGGAVAVADPGSSDSAAHGSDGTDASGQQHSTGAETPKGEPGGTDTKDGSLGPDGQPSQQQSTGAQTPKNEPGGTDTKDGTKVDSDLGVALPDPVAAVPDDVTPVSDVVAPVSDVVAPVSDVVAPVSDVVAPVSDVVAPVSDAVAPVSDAVAPVPDVVGPVSNVSALIQDMLTSVGGASPAPQLQSDLYSF